MTTLPQRNLQIRSCLIHHEKRDLCPMMKNSSLLSPSSTKTSSIPPSPTTKDICVALLREFLSANGYTKTLNTLTEEVAVVTKISSRSTLSSALGIGSLVNQNKNREQPLSSYLEVLVEHMSAKAESKKASKQASDNYGQSTSLSQASNRKSSNGKPDISSTLDAQTLLTRLQLKDKPSLLPPPPTAQRNSVDPKSDGPPKRIQSHAHQNIIITDEIEDFEDEEDSNASWSQTPSARTSLSSISISGGVKVDSKLVSDLKSILFPEKNKAFFSEEWRNKGFMINTHPNMTYGLVQLKGGPCGLLASVQAYMIKHLLYESLAPRNVVKSGRLRPTLSQAADALMYALSEILWQAGQDTKKACVVIPDNGSDYMNGKDPFTESLRYYTFTSLQSTHDFLVSHTRYFLFQSTSSTNSPHGLIYFLLSLILSRGIERIRSDMDERDTSLMGRHAYCTQELVNLVLLGKALSNLFDGVISLGWDEDTKSEKLLKGIPDNLVCQVGQLSLFEHYNNIKVGEQMKHPKYPIYVICSESHYTVLFSLSHLRHPENLSAFDLYYYDGLANQDDEIRLTIHPNRKPSTLGTSGIRAFRQGDDLVPPLEQCIRTKWKDAMVDWNGTEPLL